MRTIEQALAPYKETRAPQRDQVHTFKFSDEDQVQELLDKIGDRIGRNLTRGN